MQRLTTNPTLETNRIRVCAQPASLLRSPAEAHARHRKTCLSFVPRRVACRTRRALRAAIREVEFADWMASGGDYLCSMHQPIG